MNNQEKLLQAFATALTIPTAEVVESLTFGSAPQWDSVAHMALVTELESVFDVMLDTDEILAMSSVAISREILAKHGVEF
ncbi:acyl carrier protein [Roseateles sp.]|uniref:acyl carrier protein n=1 Tax=Roseateles sp. TaxID=1971397 RepID=UPI003BA40376